MLAPMRAAEQSRPGLWRLGVAWGAAFETWIVQTHLASARPGPFAAVPERLWWGLWVPAVMALVPTMVALAARVLWNVPMRLTPMLAAAAAVLPFAIWGVALHFGPGADQVAAMLLGCAASTFALGTYLGVGLFTARRE